MCLFSLFEAKPQKTGLLVETTDDGLWFWWENQSAEKCVYFLYWKLLDFSVIYNVCMCGLKIKKGKIQKNVSKEMLSRLFSSKIIWHFLVTSMVTMSCKIEISNETFIIKTSQAFNFFLKTQANQLSQTQTTYFHITTQTEIMIKLSRTKKWKALTFSQEHTHNWGNTQKVPAASHSLLVNCSAACQCGWARPYSFRQRSSKKSWLWVVFRKRSKNKSLLHVLLSSIFG